MQGDGNGGYGQLITHRSCNCLRKEILLLQRRVPPTANNPLQTSASVLPTICSSSLTASMWDSSPQGQSFRKTCSSVPLGLTSPFSKPSPAWAPISVGVQVPVRTQLPLPFFQRPLLGITLFWHGSLPWAELDFYSPVPSLGCRDTAALPWAAAGAAGESQLQNLEQLLLPAGLFLAHVLTLVFSEHSYILFSITYFPS